MCAVINGEARAVERAAAYITGKRLAAPVAFPLVQPVKQRLDAKPRIGPHRGIGGAPSLHHGGRRDVNLQQPGVGPQLAGI